MSPMGYLSTKESINLIQKAQKEISSKVSLITSTQRNHRNSTFTVVDDPFGPLRVRRSINSGVRDYSYTDKEKWFTEHLKGWEIRLWEVNYHPRKVNYLPTFYYSKELKGYNNEWLVPLTRPNWHSSEWPTHFRHDRYIFRRFNWGSFFDNVLRRSWRNNGLPNYISGEAYVPFLEKSIDALVIDGHNFNKQGLAQYIKDEHRTNIKQVKLKDVELQKLGSLAGLKISNSNFKGSDLSNIDFRQA